MFKEVNCTCQHWMDAVKASPAFLKTYMNIDSKLRIKFCPFCGEKLGESGPNFKDYTKSLPVYIRFGDNLENPVGLLHAKMPLLETIKFSMANGILLEVGASFSWNHSTDNIIIKNVSFYPRDVFNSGEKHFNKLKEGTEDA